MKQYKAILLIGIICFTIFLNSCHQEINEKTYKVSYIDYNGEVIQISEVKKGETVMKPAEPVREGYLFTGWSEESNNVLSDLIIIALYDKIIPQEYYQVTFNLNGGTLITGKTIQYLKAGEKPLPPVPVKDMAEFIGWDTEIKECNEDITYNAQYHELTIKRQTAQEFINTITFGWSYVGGINEDNDIDKLCDLLIEKNINTIQLPVVWMNFVDDNYQIKEETIIKLKSIVDKVISKGLYIIICSYDSYEQEWSSLTYKNLPKLLKIMNVQWTQIGEMFKDYNEKVVFSFLNEPRDYTDNLLDGEAYHVLNDANQAFIDLIRNSGGNNLYRQLIITTGWGNYDEDSYKYSIVPTDEYTSIGIHAYKPFSLIHDIIKDEQGNYLESSWDEREEEYSLALLRMVQTLKTNYLDKGFPVILSEFGSRDKNNTTDRAKWLNYYLSLTNAYNIKCFIWDGALTHFDIDATFCLIDRVNYQWAYPELTDVISNAFVNNTFLDVYEEVCEYRKSINEEIIIPKSLTNMVTKEVLNEDEFKISYDQTLIKNIEGKNYATRLGPITFKVISSNVIYYYQIDIIPEYETRHTDFTLKLANNDNGDLQCYITTKGYSSMRVDYNWFSFDETILKVSKYSTITIIGDGSTGIIAVNKETGKVGIIEVTIKDGKVISFNSVLTDE